MTHMPAVLTAPRMLRTVLAADTTLELAIGVALLMWRAEMATWLSVSEGIVLGAAVVFIAAAIVPAVLAATRAGDEPVRTLAWANIAGGAAGWVLYPFTWDSIEPEGRWLMAATFDAFIALGAAQLVTLGRLRR